MAYTFDVVGYKDFNDRYHKGSPEAEGVSPLDTYGAWVHYYDPNNSEDQGMLWIYTKRDHLHTWTEWFVFISAYMARHGLELSDG